jgi:UDP-glucuronate 4-epimerase
VYGQLETIPFSEDSILETPQGLYPITKYLNELLSNKFNSQNGTQILGLRFFSVYGPWGRPDMAPLRLIASAMNESGFDLYGNLNKERDFTYIDDVVNAIIKLLDQDSWSRDTLNVGGGNNRNLKELIAIIEKLTAKKIIINHYPADVRDVNSTLASNQFLYSEIDFRPQITLEDGIERTIDWVKRNNYQKLLLGWCSETR